MKLKIITPSKGIEINKEQVYLIEAEGAKGHFGILDNHIDFITPLASSGTLRYQTQPTNPIHEVRLKDAILEVSQNQDNQTEVKVIASSIL